jgi:hypothetical protein
VRILPFYQTGGVYATESSRGKENKMPKTKTIIINRNAKNGRIVTEDYVKKHPDTTTTEKRAVPVKPKGK